MQPNLVQAAVLDYFEQDVRRRVNMNMVRMQVREAVQAVIAEYEANGFIIPSLEVGSVTRDENGRMSVEIQLHGWPDVFVQTA